MRRVPVLAALALAVALPSAALDHAGDAWGTWRAADSPHRVLDSVRVPAGTTLVVEPGSLVVFGPAARLAVDGTLRALGTAARPIAFASAGSGVPGDWKGIVLAGAGPHVITHSDIAHATTAVATGVGTTLLMSDSAVSGSLGDAITFSPGSFGTIARCALADNGGSGVAMRDASPTLTSCRFTGNARAAWLSGASYPGVSGLEAIGNAEGDGLVLDATHPVTGWGTWRDGGLPYIVNDGATLLIEAGSETALGPGAILKMGAGARVTVAGSFGAYRNVAARSAITSLLDDSLGGDANGDGAASEPGKGDWDAIEVIDGGRLQLQGAIVAHADDAVRAIGGDALLLDCDVRQASNRGAAFGALARGRVEGTSFSDCDVALLVTDAGSVIAGLPGDLPGFGGRNSFGCNVSFDVQNLDAATLQVHRSWFGDGGPGLARLAGDVDVGTAIGAEPADVVTRRILRMARPNVEQVTFRWDTAGTCATYRLAWSAQPDGPFATLARPTMPSWTTSPNGLPPGALVFFELATER